MRDRYRWPPRHVLEIHYAGGNQLWHSSTDRFMDLGDNIEGAPDELQLNIMSRSRSQDWQQWNEATIGHVEFVVNADLGFDGYKFRLRRKTRPGKPCTVWFSWRLFIDLPRQD
jgi:hypothetical protein